jgi:hypothetical protein
VHLRALKEAVYCLFDVAIALGFLLCASLIFLLALPRSAIVLALHKNNVYLRVKNGCLLQFRARLRDLYTVVGFLAAAIDFFCQLTSQTSATIAPFFNSLLVLWISALRAVMLRVCSYPSNGTCFGHSPSSEGNTAAYSMKV